ncbi:MULTISPECIES: glutamate ABC transporter substrate-binding protein [unclassified Rathayibacter]|uniref:glutamate ABC transporter substrate-binding protein n=1 Tax=unclassified Rathayibacter TaxID=2609250 RepID=UPI00188C10FB|nr:MULTISPECIES: glutamate ABC transporter substrate-binding protein [unclassified Rathayibacter]MBF4461482.1 glutamate ABC transporter substrate-binding protein [Rathayibacter sp. VKM Ac-2879]MBF4502893.1 glutamate ABC transporter substrate-binding protein [Rathayibacter sp. VKM Ac-2878]
MNRVRVAVLALVTATVLAVAGCSSGGDDLGAPIAAATAAATPAPTTSAAPPVADCSPSAVTSYAPTGVTESTRLAEIRQRGTLRVGVSADTLLMSARNPLTGTIEGFDVDIAREMARAILGSPDAITFVVITSAQRLPSLTGGDGAPQVDMVARTLTMTCDRWSSIAFSSEYYGAGLKVLVSTSSDQTSIQGLEAKGGQKVCAPRGTTTLSRLQSDYPGVEAVAADTHTQCLALFQEGQVEAIAGDDTILAGFVAQDPYAKVVGDALSSEPYGLGLPADDVDFVRFVNGALEGIRSDGRWQSIYDRWLGALGQASPPAPVYGR